MPDPLGHFEIPAEDPDQLILFYTRLFDWQAEKVEMEGGDYTLILTVETGADGMPSQPGGINGGMYKRTSVDEKPVNYVIVDDVDSYVAKAGELGAQVAMGKMPVPGMGWVAQLVDPDGNKFGLFQSDMSAS